MKIIDHHQLVRFYFGTLDEQQTLELERSLITRPDVLVDYLDLKRTMEGQQRIPDGPSPFLLNRLTRQLSPKKVSHQKKLFVVISLSSAIAAGIIALSIHLLNPNAPVTEQASLPNEYLFDGGSELYIGRNVL